MDDHDKTVRRAQQAKSCIEAEAAANKACVVAYTARYKLEARLYKLRRNAAPEEELLRTAKAVERAEVSDLEARASWDAAWLAREKAVKSAVRQAGRLTGSSRERFFRTFGAEYTALFASGRVPGWMLFRSFFAREQGVQDV